MTTEISTRPLSSAENAGIRGAIRRWFARQPIIREVLNDHKRKVPRYKKDGTRHKVDRVEHLCNACKSWVSATVVSVDHVIPVIDVDDGFVDWNLFIARLAQCPKSNLQIICDSCHKHKTNLERRARQEKKDLEALCQLEDAVLSRHSMTDIHALRKDVRRYLTKTKTNVVKEKAKRLKAILEKEEHDD